MDIHGNTPLHYAVLGNNTAIVEKLLSCMANMEARNKDDFTPLSLAKYENKEKMVEILVTRASKTNHMESEQQLPSKYKEERPIRSSDGSNLGMYLPNSEGPQEAYNQSNNAEDLQGSPKQALSKTKSKTESRCMKLVQWIRLPPFWRLPRPPPATTTASASATAARASSGRSSGMHDLSEEDPLCRNGLTHLCCIFYYKSRIIDSCPTSDHEDLKVEEKKEQKVSKRETSRNMYDGADDSDSGGLSQQSNSEQTDKHQVSITENEESDRFTLREEKEKRRKADLLYEKNRVQLRKKEEHSIKEVEMNPQLETTIRTQNITLDIITENEVPESSEKEESLLRENCMLRDENAKLRLEIDTAKNQKQEMEKEHFEDIAIVNKKNDHLQKTIRETVFPHNEQLEVLRVENTVLNSKLEDEQQNRGRLEAEDESYRSRPATAAQDLEHCQTSKGDLQLASQTARDEGFCAGRSLYKPVEHKKEELKKYIDLNIFLQQRLQQEVNEIGDLEKEITRLKKLLKVAKQKLHECDNEKLGFPGDSKPSPADMEIQSKKPKQKNDELIAKLQPSSSKCICLDEEKTPQQELSMEPLLKRREELKDRVKKAKQEAVNLRNIEKNMVEICELEDYKKKLEERAIRDVADKVEKVNSLLQRQRASQKMSEQMINDQASTSHLELRNKELESEISKVQTSQDDIERELKKYVRLYQEELEGRKLLENQLTDFPRIKEKLAEVSNKLFWEKQLSKRNSIPRENLGIPTSNPCTSTYHRMQTLSSASISMTTRVRLPLDLQRWEQGHQGSPRAPSGFLEDTRHRLFPNEGLCSRYGRSMEKP
ncbi:ankyrin repeat domain-containing protein 26-like [Myotis yumanensis]|uniref:ankyrin repeat domain-containing protein 26-like n=1 Tax=Myotis yumanensis TaxID=159337 RepID=UPI0038D1704A